MTAQLGLAFPAGSQPVATSEDAADALSGEELNARRMKVLRLFASHRERGLTADEVVAQLGRRVASDHNTWAPRVTELLQVGLLDRYDGKNGMPSQRRRTRAGGTAFVHAINARGLRRLVEQRRNASDSEDLRA